MWQKFECIRIRDMGSKSLVNVKICGDVRRRPLRLRSVPLIVISVVVVISCNASPDPTVVTPTNDAALEVLKHDWGIRIAREFLLGGKRDFVIVNGHPVTAGEFLERRVQSLINNEKKRHELSLLVSDGEWTFEDEVSNRMNSDNGRYLMSFYLPQLEIYGKYDTNVWTLAGLISAYAKFDAAVEAGYIASDVEVAEEIHRQQESHIKGYSAYAVKGLTWTELDAYIGVVGPERYWSEIMPPRVRREITIKKWETDLYRTFGAAETKNMSRNIIREGILRAKVVVSSASGLDLSDISVNEMLAAVEEMWAFITDYRPPAAEDTFSIIYVATAEPGGVPSLRENVRYFGTPPPLREKDFLVATAGPDTPTIINRFINNNVPVATSER